MTTVIYFVISTWKEHHLSQTDFAVWEPYMKEKSAKLQKSPAPFDVGVVIKVEGELRKEHWERFEEYFRSNVEKRIKEVE